MPDMAVNLYLYVCKAVLYIYIYIYRETERAECIAIDQLRARGNDAYKKGSLHEAKVRRHIAIVLYLHISSRALERES